MVGDYKNGPRSCTYLRYLNSVTLGTNFGGFSSSHNRFVYESGFQTRRTGYFICSGTYLFPPGAYDVKQEPPDLARFFSQNDLVNNL